MTSLAQRLRRQIAATGPIGVGDYMSACLLDPDHGYYTTREPFGAAGDFVTAPEISQMFGELVAVWLYSAWAALGRPTPVTIAELGPGRGTLMADMLRTSQRLDPGFVAGADFAMIEASPRLRGVQKATLKDAPSIPRWLNALSELQDKNPVLMVANEFFDALPIRQYVKTPKGWRERLVDVGEKSRLRFIAGPGGLDDALLPADAGDAPEGAIVEISPARSAQMADMAARIASGGGAGLFVDYGYETPAIRDTLQALHGGRFDDVLAHPGEADITAHVDFAVLADIARQAGLEARIMTQGAFLNAMGLRERAEILAADVAIGERIRGEAERLAAPDRMGELFNVLAVAPAGTDVPALTKP